MDLSGDPYRLFMEEEEGQSDTEGGSGSGMDPEPDPDSDSGLVTVCFDVRTFDAALVFVFSSISDCLTLPSTVLGVSTPVF